jgi:hypothetical protein
MGIASLERSFGELLVAFGDVVVARTRGEPADPSGASRPVLARRYRARRRAFGAAVAHAGAGSAGDALAAEDARALANMRGVLPWLDEMEPTPGAPATVGVPDAEDPRTAAQRAGLYRRFGRAAGAIRVGDRTLDHLTVKSRLATEPDPAARRALFEAMSPLWRTVDGDGGDPSPYRRLLASSAERWARDGSPVEANAAALGMAPGALEPALHEVLRVWRAVLGPRRIEPWDFHFGAGAASRRLEPRIPVERLLELNRAYLAALGADPAELGIVYDVRPRPGRPPVPVAFALSMGPTAADSPGGGAVNPRPPWVFATYEEGGLGNLAELLHESGHAIHAAAVRTRPAFMEFPTEASAFLEATADLLGWDTDEPAWQRHWLGDAAEPREALLGRYRNVVLDVCWALFEIELHRHPDRRPNDVWTEVTGDGLGIEPHPEWSWWAIRGQLVDSPGYMANYALSAITAAAIRARILAARGPWCEGDPGWYRYVADGLFVAGASRTPADLLGAFLGEPLSVEPLLADLGRAG